MRAVLENRIAYLIRRLEEDRLPIYREVGLLWLFQGTTEQVTLMGAIGCKPCFLQIIDAPLLLE
jgi:hypothetical protein